MFCGLTAVCPEAVVSAPMTATENAKAKIICLLDRMNFTVVSIPNG
jgi:hypothetical protein